MNGPMLVKLDENLGQRGKELFNAAGHEALSVIDQSLAGAADEQVLTVCQEEQRCLVTLDMDFANPFLFPPDQSYGIAILRPPRRTSLQDLEACIRTLLAGLERSVIRGKLWIVDRRRVREYIPDEDPSS